jgi:glycosyltransferase involved in cell wall biosynthesis
MPGARIIHVITPGDHFSPLTGSAIPTVVDGLARAAERAGEARQSVLVDASTWRPRYDSADVVEYTGVRAPGRRERALDAARGRVGLARAAAARYFAPLAAALRDEPPRIVVAHNAPIVPWLLRDSPHTVVLYAHNDLLGTYTTAETRRMLAGVAAIVCVSESLAARTRARLPHELAERVRVVVNGVDAERFEPRPAGGSGSRPLRVMSMGRVIPDKGADVLIRAASQLDADAAEIVVVGRPGFASDAPMTDYERRLRALADACACPVRFESFVPRATLPALLQTADVFVVPSRWPDPAPLTVGEALASGLPTVASRIGGIPELMGDAGVLVEPDDPGALAAVLRRLLGDASERDRLSRAARARAEEHDWSWSWRQLSAVLDGLGLSASGR